MSDSQSLEHEDRSRLSGLIFWNPHGKLIINIPAKRQITAKGKNSITKLNCFPFPDNAFPCLKRFSLRLTWLTGIRNCWEKLSVGSSPRKAKKRR